MVDRRGFGERAGRAVGRSGRELQTKREPELTSVNHCIPSESNLTLGQLSEQRESSPSRAHPPPLPSVLLPRPKTGGLTALCCLYTLAVLLQDSDLLPSFYLYSVHCDLVEVLVDKGLDNVADMIVSQRRVRSQTHFDLGTGRERRSNHGDQLTSSKKKADEPVSSEGGEGGG